MTMKFEVGKKYQGLLNPKCIVECFFVMPSGSACCTYLTTEGRSPAASADFICSLVSQETGWKEYREPVKRWFNKYRDKDGNIPVQKLASPIYPYGWSSKEMSEHNSRHFNFEFLGAVEIEF